MTAVTLVRRPAWHRATAAAAISLGVVFAAVPSFSGLALLTVLLTGGIVGIALFSGHYRLGEGPTDAGTGRPAEPITMLWLAWTLALIGFEAFVALARDELRWPPLSAIQDPLTTANPVGRFVAGSAWVAAGIGLIVLSQRLHGHATIWGRVTACLAGASMMLLAAASVADGPMLEPRDAPSWQAEGIYEVPVTSWPFTTWLTLLVFLTLMASALFIHRLGRSVEPSAALPDLLGWVMAAWSGRLLVYALWLWCGWHFLSR